jgi:hypothetical protein
MRRRIQQVLLVLVAGIGPAVDGAIDAETRVAIRRALNEHYAPLLREHFLGFKELPRVEVSRVPGERDVFLAICDWEERWWGTFHVLGFRDGRILWIIGPHEDESPGGNHVERVVARRRWGFGEPVLDVASTTHMGTTISTNYAFRGRCLHRLEERATDPRWLERAVGNVRRWCRMVLDGP